MTDSQEEKPRIQSGWELFLRPQGKSFSSPASSWDKSRDWYQTPQCILPSSSLPGQGHSSFRSRLKHRFREEVFPDLAPRSNLFFVCSRDGVYAFAAFLTVVILRLFTWSFDSSLLLAHWNGDSLRAETVWFCKFSCPYT